MINQGIKIQKNIKHVKFCQLTKVIDFYKYESPKSIDINSSYDVFIKNNKEEDIDDETKRNDAILAQFDEDEDEYTSTRLYNRKKLKELKEVNRKWNEYCKICKNTQI